jgi:hypothetical protein
MRDEPPSPLEALRPIAPCDTADYLRFLNFTTALEKWYSLKYKYEHSDPMSSEDNYKAERTLYVATVSMQHRLYYYDPYDPEGKPTRIDRDFIKLFPERLPPMFDGQVFTMKSLLKEFKRVRQMTLTHVRKALKTLQDKQEAQHKPQTANS